MHITIMVLRPSVCLELIRAEAASQGKFAIFPDGRCLSSTDYPMAEVLVVFKKMGHVVFSNQSKERWVMCNRKTTEFDMEFFSPEWAGCHVTVCQGEYCF